MSTPTPGSKAPPFALRSDAGEIVRLADLRGKKVVVYFYPADDTEGCTVEACEFRDRWAAVRKAGATVLGVSPDGVASHGKFRAKYGVWGEKSMFGRKYFGVRRTTFVIDEAGRVERVFERVRPRGHAAEVLEALR